MKRIRNFLSGLFPNWFPPEYVGGTLQTHIEAWELAASLVPCTCGQPYLMPYLHDKQCPRYNV